MKNDMLMALQSGSDMIHMDVMDGHFVPNISFGAEVIKLLRSHTNAIFDTHLMISNPYDYIKDFSDCGSDFITFHLESNSDVIKTIENIQNFGKKVGIAINPKTDVKVLIPYLNLVDLVLVMTVNPGFCGQKFMTNQLEKVDFLVAHRNERNLKFKIQLDGGINLSTIELAKSAKADICVVGSCIFESKNVAETIKMLKN